MKTRYLTSGLEVPFFADCSNYVSITDVGGHEVARVIQRETTKEHESAEALIKRAQALCDILNS